MEQNISLIHWKNWRACFFAVCRFASGCLWIGASWWHHRLCVARWCWGYSAENCQQFNELIFIRQRGYQNLGHYAAWCKYSKTQCKVAQKMAVSLWVQVHRICILQSVGETYVHYWVSCENATNISEESLYCRMMFSVHTANPTLDMMHLVSRGN